jgi:hypothetical protein
MAGSEVFYMHEDEWGMVAVLPAENSARAVEIAQEAEEFGQEHFDGSSWSEVYVIPAEEYRLADRRIPLAELAELIGGRLPAASKVQSGYSSYVEDLPASFAFGEAYSGSGAFYGDGKDGLITTLYVIPPGSGDPARAALFAQVLSQLGDKYDLILADWWHHHVLDLRDEYAVMRHMQGVESE